jgi:hypothetical protein
MTSNSHCIDIDFIDDFIDVDNNSYGLETENNKDGEETEKEKNSFLYLKHANLLDLDNDDQLNKTLFAPLSVYLSDEVIEICRVNSLPYYFKNREETRYMIRFSQCQMGRRFTAPKSDERVYHIFCCDYPNKCQFNIKERNSKTLGHIITDGTGTHTCDPNQHIIDHCKKNNSSKLY